MFNTFHGTGTGHRSFSTISTSVRKHLPKISFLFPSFKLLTALSFCKVSTGRHYPRQVPLPRTRMLACPLTKHSSILYPNHFELRILSVMNIDNLIDSCHFDHAPTVFSFQLKIIKQEKKKRLEITERIRNNRKLIV